MHEVCVLLGAEIDIQEAYARIGAQSERRAEQFQHEVDGCLVSLRSHPRLGPVRLGSYHRLVLAGWPYALFYKVLGSRVLVHALIDLRQDPALIRRRLDL
ncbi:MAG: type II toxin-antitoxin system RelE/ParE family toxin [Chthoniobacteraceae bacterium]